jgi:predicted nuclease with TOPRIM domain
VAEIGDRLKRVDESLAKQLQRSIENNARLVARIKEMEAVLQTAQEIFAVVVNPLDCTDASVRPLWEKCREIECKIRDLLKDGAVLVPVRDDGAGRIKELEDALRKISCPHVTDRPLWWQLEARTALLANDLRDALQHIQPKDGAK